MVDQDVVPIGETQIIFDKNHINISSETSTTQLYFGQEIVPAEGDLQYSVRWLNTGEEVAKFEGASTYMFLPARQEMLDLYFVRGQGVDSDANALYQSANNHMMVQESSWRQLREGHVEEMIKTAKAGTDEWSKLLLAQSNETLKAFAIFNFQATLTHEGAHRMHFNLSPEEQVKMHDKFIEAAENEPAFRDAVNKFAEALYQDKSYLKAHKDSANKSSSFEDAYGRTAGQYDARSLRIKKDGVETEVSLGLLVSEAVAYLSGRVLLKHELNAGTDHAKELNELFTNAPLESLPARTLASRELFAAIEKSQYFTEEDLCKFFPEEMMSKVIERIDAHKNAVQYLDVKSENIKKRENAADRTTNPDIKTIDVEPEVVQTTTALGQPAECVISPYFRKDINTLHLFSEDNDLRYDMPTDGVFNLAIKSVEGGVVIPLGVLSMEMIDGALTINMIQRVKVSKREKGQYSEGEGTTEYKSIEHPKADLIQGKNKLQWQKMLLDQATKVARDNGFKEIRLNSGFRSKYWRLRLGHELRMAVQQYDRLVDNDETWVPYNSEGKPIDNLEHRKLLKATIRKLRDGEIDNVDVVRTLPPGTYPEYYQKQL